MTADFVSSFEDKDKYMEYGRGVVITRENEIVAGASSYTRYREGIEIEVDTIEPERRKYLATVACSALILEIDRSEFAKGGNYNNMKKKTIYLVVIVIVLLICIIAFFKPLSLSDIARENNQIKMVLSELGVRNGEAYIDSVDYQAITTEQKSAILTLLEKYTYRRTVDTLFSDGSISGLGDKTLSIYVYDDVSLVGSIFVSSSGRIAVNEKSYSMENAEQFIEQIIEIMGQAD